MNPFEIATNDIFENPDFVESANVGGATVPVLASERTEDAQLTEFGMDDGVSFFLRVRASDLGSAPKKNDAVVFHGVEYRAASVALDSSGLVWRIDLKSKTTR